MLIFLIFLITAAQSFQSHLLRFMTIVIENAAEKGISWFKQLLTFHFAFLCQCWCGTALTSSVAKWVNAAFFIASLYYKTEPLKSPLHRSTHFSSLEAGLKCSLNSSLCKITKLSRSTSCELVLLRVSLDHVEL